MNDNGYFIWAVWDAGEVRSLWQTQQLADQERDRIRSEIHLNFQWQITSEPLWVHTASKLQ